MAFQKIVLQYVQFNQDWKEVFYSNAASVQAASKLITPAFIATALELRGLGTYIAGVRVSDVAQPRSVSVQRLTTAPVVTGTTPNDSKNVCAVYRLVTAALNLSRPIFLRGLADSATERSGVTGQDIPSASLRNAVNGYIAAMNFSGLMVRALLPITGVNPYAFYPIANLIVNPGGTVTVVVNGPLQLGVTGRVILSQFDPKMWPGLNGHYLAQNPASPNFNISYISRNPPATYPIARGRYRVEEYRYDLIDLGQPNGQSFFVSLGSRNTQNGPFGGRGARSSRRLRYR
jgi:hypothetical protein